MRYTMENGESILYQIMSESGDGRYYPAWEALIEEANPEEKEYLEQLVKERLERHDGLRSFAFNLIYIAKQKCGHYEVFQSPYNENWTLKGIFDIALEHAQKQKCTHCIIYSNKENKKGGIIDAI